MRVQSQRNKPASGPLFGLPHSWDLSNWPSDIWPSDPLRARWVLRAYRKELLEAGALARSGRCLVVIGEGYARWLERRTRSVVAFQANNPAFRPANAC